MVGMPLAVAVAIYGVMPFASDFTMPRPMDARDVVSGSSSSGFIYVNLPSYDTEIDWN